VLIEIIDFMNKCLFGFWCWISL